MNHNKLFTPLRYPGGKAQFAPFIAQLIEQNGLTGGHYLEPYAGGAGVALDLLFSGMMSHVHINDLDPAIHYFWKAVIYDTDGLLKLIQDTPITIEQWFYWQQVMNAKIDAGDTERGFATLFMNRTNRSGILKAGVIGGKLQTGNYKLDCRFKKEVIKSRIEKISLHQEHISIHNKDALTLLHESDTLLPEKSLIYLDPPYYVKGQGLYRNFYEHDDHVNIANFLQLPCFKKPWIVSYDDVPEIRKLYESCKQQSYQLNYTAQKKYKGQEIMFFSSHLKVVK
jgi:DNA adenine methylase